ncbi:MAG: 1-acyl-sn-glycerol-3-phosphate acyltransferase [Candidatus Andersenbacteria bacterium]|nr:1-acyl-sn-glycerol-3-phosphate acyltransferase [Candidatus Andersenbacteria bacterium]
MGYIATLYISPLYTFGEQKMEHHAEHPVFGKCQVTGVKEYVQRALPEFCQRLGLNSTTSKTLESLGCASLQAAAAMIETSCMLGEVAPLKESREFWLKLGQVLVGHGSMLVGEDYLQAAMNHLQSGGNVLLIQNHRSGADTLLMEALVNQYFGYDATADWAYMSGHAVNLFLLPLMFTAAVRRFQIFSAKYQSTGLPGMADATTMGIQNVKALTSLSRYCRQGGKLVGLYPEGGRGETCMKRGESKTSCIFKLMAHNSTSLLILPTYVDGSASILPVVRGSNEYNEVFMHARVGTGTLSIGKPIPWEALEQAAKEMSDRLNQPCEQSICDAGLALVAQLAPNAEQRGPYETIRFSRPPA